MRVISSIWSFLDKTARAAADFLLGLIGKSISDEQWKAFMQFVKFGLVGAMNTVVDYVTYLVTLFIFTRLHLFGSRAYLVSAVLGFAVSFFNMFYWNNKYVFKKKEGENRSLLASFVKLFLSYSVTGIIIRPTFMYLLVDIAKTPKTIAPIPIMLITIPLNFILSKLWAFRGKNTADEENQGGIRHE